MSLIIQSQLLATKFYVPVAPGTLISRPRLSTLLDESLKHPLTLISAPAGFGKTMLLSTWAQSLPTSHVLVAWLSLDEEDNDPQLFWSYVLSALDQRQPERFSSLFKSLQSPQPPPLKQIAVALSNLLLESPEHMVLILDDYHLITDQQVHTTLSYLIEHLAPQLHIILATRTDPALPLSSLRARQQLLEVRADQLRCTAEETKTFFQDVMKTRLPDPLVAEVATRTEGWLVGLQLVGLSLQSHGHPASLLQEISGNQRYILDYLTEVVLLQQSQEAQTFLLFTCILERLTPSLCDTVMQQTKSQQMLHHLEQANLFVVSLDSKRQWYRYHALFAEALQYQLEQTHADLLPVLHHRASLWYAEHNQTTEAILHAFKAHEWQWAAKLIEHKSQQLMAFIWGVSHHQLAILRDWLEQLPIEIIGARPRLCLACFHLLYFVAPFSLLLAWSEAAEAALTALLTGQTPEDASLFLSVPPTRWEQENLLGEVLGWRAILFCIDEGPTTSLYERALSLLSEENALARAQMALAQLVPPYVSSVNDAGAAVESGRQGIRLAQEAEQLAIAFSLTNMTACFMIGAGRLHEAHQLTQQAMHLGSEAKTSSLADMGWGWLVLVHADVLREWNELSRAHSLVEEGLELCKQSETFVTLVYLLYGYATLLRLSLSSGDLDTARSALQEFHQVSTHMNQPYARHFATLFSTTVDQVRLWIACGERDQASRWVKEIDLHGHHGSPLTHERQEVARARVLLAQNLPAQALERLDPVLQRATEGRRWGHVIGIRLLQALAWQMHGKQTRALDTLVNVVHLAEPEGYIRSFVDEGASMQALLSQLREQQRPSGPTPYLDTLLAAFQEQHTGGKRQSKRARPRRRRSS